MEIKWTELADHDLQEIETYVTDNTPTRAIKLVLDIIDRAEILKDHPRFGRTGRLKNTRELVFGKLPYILVYRIKGSTIEILRVIHTSRKWP